MPKISHKVHVTIDYLSVVVFAAVPTLLGFSGADAALCYGLAVAHLMVTVSTAAPGGLLHWIPNRVHGRIEVLVGVTLLLGGMADRRYVHRSGTALLRGGGRDASSAMDDIRLRELGQGSSDRIAGLTRR